MVARWTIINAYLEKNDEVPEMWSCAKGDSLFSGMTAVIIIILVLLIAFIVLRIITKAKSKRKKQARGKRR